MNLIEAAKDGDVEKVKNFITAGACINAYNEGWTALHWAANNGHIEVCQQLIEKGARIEAKTIIVANGMTALNIAANGRYVGICKLLIENGAHTNTKDDNGLTPLHRAALWGHVETCDLLMTNGANVNLKDGDGRSALYWAVTYQHLEICKLLIGTGRVDVEEVYLQRGTILHVTIRFMYSQDCFEICQMLVQTYGADVNVKRIGCGSTALHWAAEKGYTKVCQLLLCAGADSHMKNDEGKTALDEAITQDHRDVMVLLEQAMNPIHA